MLSKHRDDILLNAELFRRIGSIHIRRDELSLTAEQQKVLEEYYRTFVRGGAHLPEEAKQRFREINARLSLLTLKFGENILKENNRFELVLDDMAALAGLPQDVIAAAAEAAHKRDQAGKWVFTLHKPSLIPFLQHSERRDLREKIFTAYIKRGDHGAELDNKAILREIIDLRIQRAHLLGYDNHASFVLEENMAKLPEKVYELLDQIWEPALARAKQEAYELQSMIYQEGEEFKLMPWDWWYYAEKFKEANYALNDELLRPYFELENVRNGAFTVARKLWGISFQKRKDIPVYHEDVEVFEVLGGDSSHLGILYTDYFPRASKRGGAWMNNYRDQYRLENRLSTPIICNVGNFAKPTTDKPSLLSLEEVLTLFHEFGHALHGLLSDCTYPLLSGTNVPRDFVELPSQIMENWALEPAVLKMYARHYATGEPIPDELIRKIRNTRHFNQGFETTEYLAASYLDMDWHILSEMTDMSIPAFEDQSLDRIGLIPEIVVRYRSPYFSHIFAGGYSAGYYSYIWAEVLDADAFQAFKEKGLFDQKTAAAFRKYILSKGGTADPMVLYRNFRGAEPQIEPLLERRGLQ